VVDLVPVQVRDARDAGEALELFDRPDGNDLLVVITHPERDRRAPVPIPRDVPVAGIREPVAEAAVTDVLGNPDRHVNSWR
jgi:hypothetical protein